MTATMFESLLAGLPAFFTIGAGGGAGFFGIKWFIEWLGGRVDKREESIERRAAGVDRAQAALNDRLEKRVCLLEKRLDRTEDELAECSRKHAESEAEVARLRAQIMGMGDARQVAQSIVAADRISDREGNRQ